MGAFVADGREPGQDRGVSAAWGRLVSNRGIVPDKATFHEELLDTYQALVEYHRAMLEGLPPDVVGKKRETLIRQLKEDFAFYVARVGGGDG